MKHQPSKRTDVTHPMTMILEREMKKPINHVLPFINLGIGDTSKANGFTLAPEIGASII